MTEIEKLAYQIQARAFYDELEALEKQAMLDGVHYFLAKEAGIGSLFGKARGLVSDIGLGAQRLSSSGGEGMMKGLKDLGVSWRKGAEVGGRLGGLGAVLKTRRGKALAAGGLGAVGAVGGLGAMGGYAAGRSGGGGVYIR